MRLEGPLAAERVALIVAHPDDETIGAAGILPHLGDVSILHVTDGAPRSPDDARAAGCATREEYASLRRRELVAALAEAGIAAGRAHELGITDQEASLELAGIARHIAAMMEERRPSLVLTHTYEGGHPDHDATAFGVHAACALTDPAPIVYEFPLYRAGVAGDMLVGSFLPQVGVAPLTIELCDDARSRKQRMYACYASQQHMLRNFPIGVESFRPAPRYDFTCPPHPGQLFYEQFQWGMTGERFRALVREALAELGIGGRP